MYENQRGIPVFDCNVNGAGDSKQFVGIRSENNKVTVWFPIGYRLGDTRENQEADIRLLLRVLLQFSEKMKKMRLANNLAKRDEGEFPFASYLFVLSEYYSRGYYHLASEDYKVGASGTIDWARTIKTQVPYDQDGSFVYPFPVVRVARVDAESLITRINEYCVFEAQNRIGFLFPPIGVKKPEIPLNARLFIQELRHRLNKENNDRNVMLLKSMIDIVEYSGNNPDGDGFKYGVDKFDPIWEELIDYKFGNCDKTNYYPHGLWFIPADNQDGKEMKPLKPDTIVMLKDKVLILDAKYYHYGVSGSLRDLPGSADINKQITYGEYVDTLVNKDKGNRNPISIFNFFLLPYNKDNRLFDSTNDVIHFGEARGDWKNNKASYERIQGVLVDTKWLMEGKTLGCQEDIQQLELIANRMFG